MAFWLRFARGIDGLSNHLGRLTGWLTLLMVLIGAYNAVVRYLGRFMGWSLSSNLYIELQWYLFACVFLLAAGWTLQQDRHVRVDVLYGRLDARKQAMIDIAGLTLFLVPFCLFGLWASIPAVKNSWAVWEMSPDPGGLPRYPIKTLVPVAFALVLLQGVAEWIKRVAFLLGAAEAPGSGASAAAAPGSGAEAPGSGAGAAPDLGAGAAPDLGAGAAPDLGAGAAPGSGAEALGSGAEAAPDYAGPAGDA